MRRVVVTGLGIVSSIGNNAEEVTGFAARGAVGHRRGGEYAELGFRCQVHGAPKIDLDKLVDRRARRFQGAGAGLAMSPWTRPSPMPASSPSDVSIRAPA